MCVLLNDFYYPISEGKKIPQMPWTYNTNINKDNLSYSLECIFH